MGAVPAHARLVEMGTAYWVSRIVFVAAEIGVADLLAGGAMTAEEVAGRTGMHGPSLYRLMRTLGQLGILVEDAGHRFALTEMGQALRDGAPGGARAAILTLGGDAFVRGFSELSYSVRTGRSGFEKALGMPVFDWLAKNPEEASRFSQTMVAFHGSEAAAVAAAYDFSGMGCVVDVGGATGHLLTTILGRYPECGGVLYDLPHVVAEAGEPIAARGLTDRVRVEGGSFFDRVPAGGDAYLLSHIIHDWSEAQCLAILGNCRREMRAGAKLLMIEMVLPTGNEPHPGKMLDIMMLVGPGGQERTEGQYRELLGKAGLRLARVVPTESAVSVVEAVVG